MIAVLTAALDTASAIARLPYTESALKPSHPAEPETVLKIVKVLLRDTTRQAVSEVIGLDGRAIDLDDRQSLFKNSNLLAQLIEL